MRAVTVDATDLGLGMRGAFEVGMRSHVAGQTARVHLLRGSFLEDEDLGFITTTGHVLGTGTMASFATLVGGLSFGIEGCLPMRRFLPRVIDLLMARLAGFRSHILGNIFGRILRYFGGGRTGHG